MGGGGYGRNVHSHVLEIGDFSTSFFTRSAMGLPRFDSSFFANLAFARLCAGVWACKQLNVSYATQAEL